MVIALAALKDHAHRQPVTRCKPLDALPNTSQSGGISQRHHSQPTRKPPKPWPPCALPIASVQLTKPPATVRKNARLFPPCY